MRRVLVDSDNLFGPRLVIPTVEEQIRLIHQVRLRGDAAGAHRSYDLAHELLGHAEPEPDLPWGTWLSPTYIEVHRARSSDVLGQHRQAADGFRLALRTFPAEFRRDRGVYLAQEASAYMGLREIDRAAATALEALSIGADTHSGRITAELTRLDERLAPWREVPGVKDVHEALAGVNASKQR